MSNIKNNRKMTSKVFLFVGFVVVSLIFGTSIIPVADAQTSTIDTTDYFVQAVIAFEESKKLDREIAEDEKRIKELKDKLKTSSDKIENILLSSELQQIVNLKNAKEHRVLTLQNEINQLEQKNVQANTVDSITENNYITIENAFYAKYLDETSLQFIGDNPVEGIFIDSQFKEFIILINPTEIRNDMLDIDSLISEYDNTVNKMPGYDLTIKIELTEFVNIACSARDGNCNPLYGGITVANEDEHGDTHISTLGYKAKKGNADGFIITAHQAGALSKNIIQPHDNTARIVGTVDKYQKDRDCDCAFVGISSGYSINNEIYKSKNTSYNVTGKVADSSQSKNTWVYKSGAKTGVTLGKITSNISGSNINLVRIYLGPGDSGSPVFKTTSGNNVDLYGMIYASTSSATKMAYGYYYPWDHINSKLGTSLP